MGCSATGERAGAIPGAATSERASAIPGAAAAAAITSKIVLVMVWTRSTRGALPATSGEHLRRVTRYAVPGLWT
jgi:hypothetical protein